MSGIIDQGRNGITEVAASASGYIASHKSLGNGPYRKGLNSTLTLTNFNYSSTIRLSVVDDYWFGDDSAVEVLFYDGQTFIQHNSKSLKKGVEVLVRQSSWPIQLLASSVSHTEGHNSTDGFLIQYTGESR